MRDLRAELDNDRYQRYPRWSPLERLRLLAQLSELTELETAAVRITQAGVLPLGWLVQARSEPVSLRPASSAAGVLPSLTSQQGLAHAGREAIRALVRGRFQILPRGLVTSALSPVLARSIDRPAKLRLTNLDLAVLLHGTGLRAQAEQLALELLLAVLWEVLPAPTEHPLVEEPRTWVCVCGSERLAGPVVPRGPGLNPLLATSHQGHRFGWSLAA